MDLCPQSGYGQVMGSAVLVRWYFGSPGHGVRSFGTLVLSFFLGG